jgi:multidrug efflux pump subunit AcrB
LPDSWPAFSVSFGLAPFLGENFFPAVDSGHLMHIRAQSGTRIEETARLFDRVEQTVRQTIPSAKLDNIVDNIGLSYSGINVAYQNTGTIGPGDGDALRDCARSVVYLPLLNQ